MAFNIRMGLPEMAVLWNDLSTRKQQERPDKDEEKFFKKLVKALGYLGQNPRHNSLASHEIDDLTRKYGLKIFQSYLENNTPSAGRMFWAYGPDNLEFEDEDEDDLNQLNRRILADDGAAAAGLACAPVRGLLEPP